MLSERVTDKQVRRYPVLSAIATEYARAYDGDFEPLIEARAMAAHQMLDGSVARKVLNCLRQETDPWFRSLQLELESVLREEALCNPPERPHLQVVRDEPCRPKWEKSLKKAAERPDVLVFASTLHTDLAAPRTVQGNLHQIETHELRWVVRRTYGWKPLPGRNPLITLYWKCGNICHDVKFYFSEDEAILDGRKFCRKCFPRD